MKIGSGPAFSTVVSALCGRELTDQLCKSVSSTRALLDRGRLVTRVDHVNDLGHKNGQQRALVANGNLPASYSPPRGVQAPHLAVSVWHPRVRAPHGGGCPNHDLISMESGVGRGGTAHQPCAQPQQQHCEWEPHRRNRAVVCARKSRRTLEVLRLARVLVVFILVYTFASGSIPAIGPRGLSKSRRRLQLQGL